MIGNSKGSSTIESVIVVPLIFIIIVSFIILMISGYQFSVTVLKSLNQHLIDGEPIEVQGQFRTISITIDKEFSYNHFYVSSRSIQEAVEYAIYLSEQYIKELEYTSE